MLARTFLHHDSVCAAPAFVNSQRTKPETRMPKPERIPNPESKSPVKAGLLFGFRASGFFRNSGFGFRICAASTTCGFVWSNPDFGTLSCQLAFPGGYADAFSA
jgi:hypothetical protein